MQKKKKKMGFLFFLLLLCINLSLTYTMSASAAIQKDSSIPFFVCFFFLNIIKTICYIIASSSSSSWVYTDAISIHTQEGHRKDPSSWVFDVDKSLEIIQSLTLSAVLWCVLYLYFNSRYARRRLTFCGHFWLRWDADLIWVVGRTERVTQWTQGI